MELLRLRGRKICDGVLRKGILWKGKHIHARILCGAPRRPDTKPHHPALYVGVIASRKLDKSAVKRNRMRRRCREALRLVLKESADNAPTRVVAQLLLLPRSSSLTCAFAELRRDSESLIHFLSRTCPKLQDQRRDPSSNSR